MSTCLSFFLAILSSVNVIAQTSSINLKYHPRLEGLSLGSGVNFNDIGLYKQSAFTLTTNQVTRTPHVKVQALLTKSSTTVDKLLEYESKIDVSLPLIDVGMNGELNTTVHATNQDEALSVVFVLQSTYNPEVPKDNGIQLTNNARKLTSKPGQFIQTYGSYYCSSITKGHIITVKIALTSSTSSLFISLFTSGKISIPLEVLDLGAQMNLRAQIQKTASTGQANITIDAYGGPEVKDYSGIVEVLKGPSNLDGVLQFLKEYISKIDYTNSKPVECNLSDYSSWGVNHNFLVRADLMTTQSNLKELCLKISKIINSNNIIFSNPSFGNNYSAQQKQIAQKCQKDLIKLRRDIYNVHNRLNLGDERYVGKELDFNKRFNEIASQSPEVFEFLVSRVIGQPVSYIENPINITQNQANISNVLKNTLLFNTINSPSCFLFIDKIEVVNEETMEKVEEINFGSISSSIIQNTANLNFIRLADLIEPSRLPLFLTNLDLNIGRTLNGILMATPPVSSPKYQYSLVIIDKASRQYKFPLLDVNLSKIVGGSAANVTHILHETCCVYENNFDFLSSSPSDSPADVLLSFKNLNLHFSDLLVVNVRTDNPNVNNALDRSIVNLKWNHQEFLNSFQKPIKLNLGNVSNQINQIVISYYSKNQSNQRDSKIYTMTYPYTRKICNNVLYLSTE